MGKFTCFKINIMVAVTLIFTGTDLNNEFIYHYKKRELII